jgi:hypothetical protein
MLSLTRLFLLGSISSLLAGGRLAPGPVAPDSSALEFLGFQAGAQLADLDAQVRRSGGDSLRCRRSRLDERVMECRAQLREHGAAVDVWVSAIDSAAGVITLSRTLNQTQLEEWRTRLQQRYGSVEARVQGSQRMLQWVRHGRMLRLTWRLESSGKVASVSLVDGRVLDNWGKGPRGSRSGSSPRTTSLNP